MDLSVSSLSYNPVIEHYLSFISLGKVVDLGAGNGANTVFLAQNGFDVVAIDRCIVSLESALKRAKKPVSRRVHVEKKPIESYREDSFEECSLVILSMVLHFLKKTQGREVLGNIKNWLSESGFVFVSVFSKNCESYKKCQDSLEQVEEDSFVNSEGQIFCYYSKEEIEALFEGYATYYLDERKYIDFTHGKPHYHTTITYLGSVSVQNLDGLVDQACVRRSRKI